MSAKYERVKQMDLLLPAPLRWLVRAFSSIALAVVLLALVALYGIVASVPLGLLGRGVLLAGASIATLGPAALGAAWLVGRRGEAGSAPSRPGTGRFLAAAGLLLLGVGLNVAGWRVVWSLTATHPWFITHRATAIYRLPFFEMTELEFYGWWPMKLILGLFIVNLIWATIRRIEFTFANLGVLMVHGGIVLLALGAVIYGRFKVEGDVLLWRQDLGGRPAAEFYDATTPALYVSNDAGQRLLAVNLQGLPRYNDYLDGFPRRLDLRLHELDTVRAALGPDVRVRIDEFVAYGSLAPTWVEADAADPAAAEPNPALRVVEGDRDHPSSFHQALLLALQPDERVLEMPEWAVELLYRPEAQRVADLSTPVDAPESLIVEIPGRRFRAIYGVQKGQTLALGDTGWTLRVLETGPYGMAFVSPGYENATDTRALVEISDGQRTFRRMVMHRYPERSQDFVPAPDDPTVGPMGRRAPVDPSIRLVYLDGTRSQFHLIARQPDLRDLVLIARQPGRPPVVGALAEDRFPLGRLRGRELWVHVTDRLPHAAQAFLPRITPKAQRNPRDEGTYLHALLPVDLEADVPGGGGAATPWRQRVWLAHMMYPDQPEGFRRPIEVRIPGRAPLRLAFGRWVHRLPFAAALEDFQTPLAPGTDQPRDYFAHLQLARLGADGSPGPAQAAVVHLNHPTKFAGYKLSQLRWDPGDADDPALMSQDSQGRFQRRHRYTVLGVGNNRGIQVVFAGGCLIALGVPWAFYLKPWLVRRSRPGLPPLDPTPPPEVPAAADSR